MAHYITATTVFYYYTVQQIRALRIAQIISFKRKLLDFVNDSRVASSNDSPCCS